MKRLVKNARRRPPRTPAGAALCLGWSLLWRLSLALLCLYAAACNTRDVPRLIGGAAEPWGFAVLVVHALSVPVCLWAAWDLRPRLTVRFHLEAE